MNQPNRILRIVFWIIFGFLSTFFAEALSGSAPDFFFTAFGYFGNFPIYALHSLLLAVLVIGRRKPFSLRTLYLTGLLFGMYEAYITKVLWQPPWNPDAISVANVAVFETLMLVVCWHAVFSFLLPLFWIEGLALSSNHLAARLPEKWRKRLIGYGGAGLTGLVGGILSGNALGSPEEALFLLLANCLIITLMLAFWKLITRKKRFDLADVLPHRLEVIILAVLLAADYLVFGLNLNRHVLPGVVGHAAVLLLYALIGLLIYLSMRKDSRQNPEAAEEGIDNMSKYNFKHWLVFCLSLIASTSLINFLSVEVQEMVAGIVLLSLTGCGVVFLFNSIRSLVKRNV